MRRRAYFDHEKAERAVRFIESLRLGSGKWAGVPFTLAPFQRQIVRDVFGWMNPDGTRRYRTVYVEVPRKNGKALALDTPIPTPDGWTTMGNLRAGDTVFAADGSPTEVVAVGPVQVNRPCFRVRFSDGEEIIADAEHEWLTTAHVDSPGRRSGRRLRRWKPPSKTLHRQGDRQYVYANLWRRQVYVGRADDPATDMRYEEMATQDLQKWPVGASTVTRVRTTAELLATLRYGRRGDRNHCVPLAGPLILPERSLPLPPYVLGVWLGDGTSADARLTSADPEVVAEIEREGVPVHSQGQRHCFRLGTGDRRAAARRVSPHVLLRELGVLGNKHIPISYLRASADQRMALLQGLMDSDGYVSRSGLCEFTTTSPALRDGMIDLLAGLGFKFSVAERRAMLYGKDCGPKWRIVFFAYADRPVFRLPRKRNRLRRPPASPTRSRTRQIVAIEPVPSVPVRCIQVAAPSGMFLAGRRMVPTHNSALAAAIAAKLLFADGEMGAEVYGAAYTREQAGIVFRVMSAMVRQSPTLRRISKVIGTTKRIVVPRTDSFYWAIPAEAAQAHGFNPSGVVFDEMHVQRTRDLYDALSTAGGARAQPLMFIITTAGYDRQSLCWELHQYAEGVLKGTIEDPTFYPVMYSAPPEADWTDENVWKACNPALGLFRDIDELRMQCRRAQQMPALENTFRQLYLCQWPQQANRWISLHLWDANAGVVDEPNLVGRPCYGFLDLSSVSDMTAWVMIFPHADDPERIDVLARFWVPEARLYDSTNPYRAQYQDWARRGFLKTTPGNAVDYAFVKQQVIQDAVRFGLRRMNIDRLFQGAQLGMELADELGRDRVFGMGMGFISFAAPMAEFERRLLAHKINHGGNPILRWMADNVAVQVDPAGNMKPDKAASQGKIDGIVGIVGAIEAQMRDHNAPQVVLRAS